MAPINPPNLLSPAELAYLHSSLSLTPPIRPDARTSTQFRPLVAETDILPLTNGSARVCFADGTEAVVGVKAEVEKTLLVGSTTVATGAEGTGEEEDAKMGTTSPQQLPVTSSTWLEISIEIPSFRDDDPLPIFLATMLTEALLASGSLLPSLYINPRWHWRLYIDILLLSPPLSYPLPLLSLTTHLALLATRLPRLKSEGEEDPLFDDDWDAAVPLYPRSTCTSTSQAQKSGSSETRTGFVARPPVTLLVMAVGANVIFDPSREELAVAEAVLAVSLTSTPLSTDSTTSGLRLLSIRTIDPPSRLTTAGVPDTENSATGGGQGGATGAGAKRAGVGGQGEQGANGVWYPPRGGMKRDLIGRVLEMCLKKGGVGEEVLAGLEGVEVG